MNQQQPSLADRLVAIMDLKRKVDEVTAKLGTAGEDPRFAIDMAAREVMNGLDDHLGYAYRILDRLFVLAERTKLRRKKGPPKVAA